MRWDDIVDRVKDAISGDGAASGEGYLDPATDSATGNPAAQGLGQQGIFPLSDNPESIGAMPLDESREDVLPASEDPRGNPAGERHGWPASPDARNPTAETDNPVVGTRAPTDEETDEPDTARATPYP